MRVGLVRNVGLSITALAVLALGGCNSDPLSFDVKDTVGIQANPTEMVVAAGRTAELESRAVNQGNEPTFDAVAAAVDPTCGLGAITVVPDPQAIEIQPPGLFVVTGGSVLGQTCVVLTSGSNTAQIDVTVVADDIEITAPVDGATVRAGDVGQVVAQLIGLDGAVAGPYAPEDAVFTSDNTDAVAFTDDMGNFTTVTSGSATVTVTWAGQELNGTSGLGVVVSDEILINVVPGVPVAAAFGSDPLGAFVVGAVDDFEVVVTDAEGNVTTDETEITGVTVVSSAPAVATATAALVPGASVNVIVTVSAVGGGATTISGVVQTTNGDLPYSADYFVPAPSITSLSAVSGVFAETITITGEQFSFPGLVTLVYVDGEQLGNFTIVSDTEITAQMPTYADPSAGHLVVVNVNGIESVEAITWEQTNSCVAQDFPDEPDFDGPFVLVSLPLECNGTLAGPQDDWFFTDVSVDALGGGSTISATLAPEWTAIKDIDWFYCTAAIACTFAIDELPSTFTQALDAATHVWVADDFAGFGGNATPQPYTVIVTID